MKAERQKEPFTPVVLTLETQEEVNALALIFNHAFVMEEAGLGEVEAEVIGRFATTEYSGDAHMAYNAKLKSRFPK